MIGAAYLRRGDQDVYDRMTDAEIRSFLDKTKKRSIVDPGVFKSALYDEGAHLYCYVDPHHEHATGEEQLCYTMSPEESNADYRDSCRRRTAAQQKR